MEAAKSQRWMKGIRIVFLIFSLALGCYFVLGELLIHSVLARSHSFSEAYEETWICTRPGEKAFTIPSHENISYHKGDTLLLQTVLPDHVSDNTYLCIDTQYADWTAYVGKNGSTADEKREYYFTRNIRKYAKSDISCIAMIPLDRQDAGMTLTLALSSQSRGSVYLSKAIYGDGLGIYKYYFKHYGVYLLSALFLTVFSVIVIIFCIVLSILKKRMFRLLYLAIGIAYASIWMILNSTLIELLLPNSYVANEVNFLIVMFLPLPFCIYIDYIQEHRYQKGFVIAGIGSFLLCAVLTLLYVANIMDYHASFNLTAAYVGTELVYLISTLVRYTPGKNARPHRLVTLGVIIAALSGGVQIISYVVTVLDFSGFWLTLGMAMLLALASIDTFVDMIDLEKEKEQANAANSAKSAFLANMSHEIRTPINSVLGMNEMILRSTTDEQIREYAFDVDTAAKNLLGLVNEILDLSKIESGKMTIHESEYALSSLIHDTVNIIYSKANAKHLEFKVTANPDLPAYLLGDEQHLRQIMINLLTNAVKYTNEGRVTLIIDKKKIDDSFYLFVTVMDTGIGIKEKDLDKLFEKFERIEENRNRHIEGTGLGMTITCQLLEMMGSHLKVKSVYGEGSTFSFALKQQVAGDEKLGDLEQRFKGLRSGYTYESAFEAPNAKILVVDDNAMNRKVFALLLSDTKMEIDQAESGPQCLAYAKEKKYDMIFLDHMMPDMDGIQTLQLLRQNPEACNARTPVVALTANAIAGAKEMYLNYGFDDFLSKPIENKELIRVLESFIPQKIIQISAETPSKSKLDITQFPALEGISWESALERLGNADLIYASVMDLYKTITYDGDELDKLFSHLQEPSILDTYRIRIHAMKTMLATIGAQDLSDFAKILEHAAAANRSDLICRLHPAFLAEWYRCKEILKPMTELTQSEKKPVTDPSAIMMQLDTLVSAVKNLDVDTADAAIAELLQYSYTKEISSGMEKLEAAELNLDEAAVTALTEKIAELISRTYERSK